MGGGGVNGEDEGDVVLMMGGRTTATEEKQETCRPIDMSVPYLSWSGGGRKGAGELARRGESW